MSPSCVHFPDFGDSIIAAMMAVMTDAGGPDAEAPYRVYADLAEWWPMISPPHEYAQEAAYLADFIEQHLDASPRRPTVLDLGSGGGHVAVHLKPHFNVTLVDLSDDMLTTSRQLNRECEHLQGDMRTLRLGRTFDVVLVHDAVDYIIGIEDLHQVIETAAVHCRPRGLALFVPDYVKDTFTELAGSGGGGVDADGRTATFTEHTWDPDPGDDWVQADYEFVLQDPEGDRRVIRESHRLSAYSRAIWHDVIEQVGGLRLIREHATNPRTGLPYKGRRPDNFFPATRPER